MGATADSGVVTSAYDAVSTGLALHPGTRVGLAGLPCGYRTVSDTEEHFSQIRTPSGDEALVSLELGSAREVPVKLVFFARIYMSISVGEELADYTRFCVERLVRAVAPQEPRDHL